MTRSNQEYIDAHQDKPSKESQRNANPAGRESNSANTSAALGPAAGGAPKDDPKRSAGSKKAPLHLIPPAPLPEIAAVLQGGADKYGPWNWRESEGVKVSTYVAAIRRHLDDYWQHGRNDPESSKSHFAHIAASCLILLDAASVGKLIEDLPPRPVDPDEVARTIYIAGPMRGINLFNFPAFDDARDRLEAKGWNVISPADLDRQTGFNPESLPKDYDWRDLTSIGFNLDDAIKRDVSAIQRSGAIYLLEGWEKSTGATGEKALADWRGLMRYEERHDKQVPSPPLPSGDH
jgi:hypothetical protein